MKRIPSILLALTLTASANGQNVDLTQQGADFSPDSPTNQQLNGTGWFIDNGSYPDSIDTSQAETITLSAASGSTSPSTKGITPGPGGDACLWVFGGETKGSCYITLDLMPNDGGLIWMYGYLEVYIFSPNADLNNPEPWIVWSQPIAASWKVPGPLNWNSGDIQKLPSGCTVIATFSGVAVGWRTLRGPTLYVIAPCRDSMIIP